MANYLSTGGFTGLNTIVVGVPTADSYVLTGTLTLPNIQSGASSDSQVVVTVLQNSSTMYTGLAGARGFRVPITAAANDLISIALSSSASIDQGSNVIRCSFHITEGLQ